MKKSSKFVRLLAAAAMVVVGALSASAQNGRVNLNVAENNNKYPLSTEQISYVEYKSGQMHPNLYIDFVNADEAAKVSKYDISYIITGPDGSGYTSTKSVENVEPPKGGATVKHQWLQADDYTVGGTYTMELKYTFKYVDESTEPLVENFTATFDLPTVEPKTTIEFSSKAADGGANFTYNITVAEGKTAEDVQSVWLNFDTVKYGVLYNNDNADLSGTVLVPLPADQTEVYFKCTVTYKDKATPVEVQPYNSVILLECNPGTSVEIKPVVTVTHSIIPGEFVRTSPTEGTLGCQIALNDGDDPKDIVKWQIKVSRVGDENMDVKEIAVDANTTYPLSYEHNLTGLPENAKTQVWPKAKVVYRDGKTSDWKQVDNVFVDTTDTGTGISDVTVAADAEAAYFNLQGVRVAEPVAGQIYIVVKDGKATKAVVR